MDGRWESLRFPPPSLLLHAPRCCCCCCSELQPLFGACRGIQHRGGESSKNSLLQPPGAPLLPEGAMAKWVSPDLLQSPYAQWGHFSP